MEITTHSQDLYEKALETADPYELAQVLTDLVCEISLAGGQSLGDWVSTVTQMRDRMQAHAESARRDAIQAARDAD
jgi:hypothetical protein